MITKLKLKNFKCYKECEFEFENLTIFCGNNSVGKSTAIQSIAIPFQSKFANEVALNGNLVDLGSVYDIYSSHADTDDNELIIEMSFDQSKGFTWGFKDQTEKDKLKNHLLNIDMSADRNELSKFYFTGKGFQFLQAERFGPRSYLENNNDEPTDYWLGARGEYIHEILTRLSNAGERLAADDKRILKVDEGASYRRNIINWMNEISPGFNFESHTVNQADISHTQFQAYGSKNTNPIHMGFGLSYSLSIICALILTKPGGLVVIENPEAHLHPRGQSYIGRLIAKAALAGVQVIVETHSDHLLNGIRVGARLDSDYIKGMFKVFYISGVLNSESNVDEITIGSKGELSSWPEGFFDQQTYDMKTLMKGEEVNDIRRRG